MLTRITFLLMFFFALSANGQAPQQLSYQAILRDVDNKLLSEQKVSVRISILQKNVEGKAVYQEEHLATTNINGLVTLQIGTGKTSQNFASIQWNDGPFFIKTEAVPSDGNKYSIVGTTQILSVPFALYANSSDTVIGDIHETDPAFQNSVAANITVSDTIRWGEGTTDTNQNESIQPYQIGDLAQGGVIFWVDRTGYHGLVCALHNLSSHSDTNGAIWMDEYDESLYDDIKNTQADGIGAGALNTLMILLTQKHEVAEHKVGKQDSVNAAVLCSNYYYPTEWYDGIQGFDEIYGDFYLPSIHELRLLHKQIEIVNQVCEANGGDPIRIEWHWSSMQYDAERNEPFFSPTQAWMYNMRDYDGDFPYEEPSPGGKNSKYMVRPVRKF